MKIPIVHIGLGPLGIRLLHLLAGRVDTFDLVGAVDINPDLAGKSVAELTGHVVFSNVTVQGKIPPAPDGAVAIITTVSTIAAIHPQIEACLEAGYHVVTTCEELFYPWHKNPDLSVAIDTVAKRCGRVVLGTGVNPGFMMDFLPQALTAICHRVDRVIVERYQDASTRRLPFQKKIGAGLTMGEFEARKKDGSLRHVGLEESMHLIAAQLGWKLDTTEDIIEPIIADTDYKNGETHVVMGDCLGVKQTGRGLSDGKEIITLRFQAALGLENPRDRVEIEGEPGFESIIPGGIPGDIATNSIILNATRSVRRIPPGLKTMAEVPGISWFDSRGA